LDEQEKFIRVKLEIIGDFVINWPSKIIMNLKIGGLPSSAYSKMD
jgi:hypothetical protein